MSKKEKVDEKEDFHHTTFFNLNSPIYIITRKQHGVSLTYNEEKESEEDKCMNGKDLLNFLREFLQKEFRNCRVCGGILPEIGFFYKNKAYYLTCYEIKGNKKTSLTTNYIKLRDHLVQKKGIIEK